MCRLPSVPFQESHSQAVTVLRHLDLDHFESLLIVPRLRLDCISINQICIDSVIIFLCRIHVYPIDFEFWTQKVEKSKKYEIVNST